MVDPKILEQVYAVIEQRRGGDADASHTARLFAKGRGKIAQKVGEEAVETVIAALTLDQRGEKSEVVAESADLLYHLLVLWAETGVEPAEVWAELARRQGISGIAEKASRSEQD